MVDVLSTLATQAVDLQRRATLPDPQNRGARPSMSEDVLIAAECGMPPTTWSWEPVGHRRRICT
jgi:hypothetical protein